MLVNRVLNSVIAGFVAVLIGFASTIALIYQTVTNLGGDAALAASWLLALGLSIGITTIGLSLYYRMPILIAWSTPGAALLIVNVQGVSLNEAIGGFMFSALLIFICGISGLFEKLMNRIPYQLTTAMLAGILINFGIGVFNHMNNEPVLILTMFVVYLLSRRFFPSYSMLFVLGTGITLAWQLGLITSNNTALEFSDFTYIAPELTLQGILSVGLPLFIVTMASQNLPGIVVLKAHGYKAPVSSILSVTGFCNFVSAPFGCFAINFAAITAAICMSKEVDEDPNKRYWASIFGGIFYILVAVFSGYLMGVFATFPAALIFSLAGIALFPAISSSIQQSLSDNKYIEASIVVLLITASDLMMLGVSSVLWGLIAGIVTVWVQQSPLLGIKPLIKK